MAIYAEVNRDCTISVLPISLPNFTTVWVLGHCRILKKISLNLNQKNLPDAIHK